MDLKDKKSKDWLSNLQNLVDMRSEIIAFNNHFDTVTEKKETLVQEIDKNLTLCYKEKIELLAEESKFEMMNPVSSDDFIIPRIVCSNLKQFMGFSKKAVSLTFELLFKNPEAFLKFTKLFGKQLEKDSDKLGFIIDDIVNLSFCDYIHNNKGTLRFLNAIDLLIADDIDEFLIGNNNKELKFMSSSTILGKITRAFLNNSDNRAYARFIVRPIISQLEITESDQYVSSFEHYLEQSFSQVSSDLKLSNHKSLSKTIFPKKRINIIDNFYTLNLGQTHINYNRKDSENDKLTYSFILSKKPDDVISPDKDLSPSKASEIESFKKVVTEKLIVSIIEKMKYMPSGLRLLCKLLSKKVEENIKISPDKKKKITRKLVGLLIFSRLIKNQWLDPDIYDTSYSCSLSYHLKEKLEETYKWVCLIVLSDLNTNTKIKNQTLNNLCYEYLPQIDKYVEELTNIEYPNFNEIGKGDEIQISSVVISLQAASLINQIIIDNMGDFTLIDELFGKIPQRLHYYFDKENKGNPSPKEFEYEPQDNTILSDIQFKKAIKYVIINDITFKEIKLDNEIQNDKLALAFQHLLLSTNLENYVPEERLNDSSLINLLIQMNKLPEFFAISQSCCLDVKMLANYILLTIKDYSEKETLSNQLEHFMQMYKVLRIIVEEKSIKLEKEINMCIRTLQERSYNLQEYKIHFQENFIARKIAQEFIMNSWEDNITIEFESHKKTKINIEKDTINSSTKTSDITFRFCRSNEEEKGNLASAIFIGNNSQTVNESKNSKKEFTQIKSVDSFIAEYSKYPEIRDMIVQNKDSCGIGKVYLDFIDFVEIGIENLKMIKYFPAAVKDNVYDQIENYIIMKMYSNIYPSEASPQDLDLLKKMQEAADLKPEAFDVKPTLINEEIWDFVKKEIRNFDTRPTPSQKIKAVVNAFKTIGESVRAYSEKDDAGGADDLLPILVYCITKAQPKRFSTNLNYVRLFRNPKRITGEAEYCLKNMYFSQNFIFKIEDAMKNNSREQKEEKVIEEHEDKKQIEANKDEEKDKDKEETRDLKELKEFKEATNQENKIEKSKDKEDRENIHQLKEKANEIKEEIKEIIHQVEKYRENMKVVIAINNSEEQSDKGKKENIETNNQEGSSEQGLKEANGNFNSNSKEKSEHENKEIKEINEINEINEIKVATNTNVEEKVEENKNERIEISNAEEKVAQKEIEIKEINNMEQKYVQGKNEVLERINKEETKDSSKI